MWPNTYWNKMQFTIISNNPERSVVSDLGSSEGIWAGRVSSTSLRSLWASLRKSATCTWSFLRSTASIAASLRTAVMKASSGSSVDELEEPKWRDETQDHASVHEHASVGSVVASEPTGLRDSPPLSALSFF